MNASLLDWACLDLLLFYSQGIKRVKGPGESTHKYATEMERRLFWLDPEMN